MDLKEITENYRSYKKIKRIAACAIIGCLMPIYDWYDNSQRLDEEVATAHQELATQQVSVNGAKTEIAELPKLQEQKSGIEQALEKAKRILPDSVDVEEILGKIAALEKESGVHLISLKPQKERVPDANLRYAEIPYDIVIEAEFNRIMVFFDQMLHQDKLVSIRDIKFIGRESEVKSRGREDKMTNGNVQASAQIVFYKGAEPESALSEGLLSKPPKLKGENL